MTRAMRLGFVVAVMILLASFQVRAESSSESRPATSPAAVSPVPGTPAAGSATDRPASSAPAPEQSAPLPGGAIGRPFTPKPVPLSNVWCCDPSSGYLCEYESLQMCLSGSGYPFSSYIRCVNNCGGA
jgi:hypothetical protein